VTIYKGSVKGHLAIRTDIRVESTDLPMIEKCASLMGEVVSRPLKIGKPLMRPRSTKYAWRIQIHRKRELLIFLDFIVSALVTKQKEVDLVLQYLRRSCAVAYYKPDTKDFLLIARVKKCKTNGNGGSHKDQTRSGGNPGPSGESNLFEGVTTSSRSATVKSVGCNGAKSAQPPKGVMI